MAIGFAPKNEPRRAEPKKPDPRQVLAEAVKAAEHLSPDPEYGRHNLVERFLQERDAIPEHEPPVVPKPPAKPSLPKADAPSKIKASRKDQRKAVLSIRIDPDVLEDWRSTGPGWQARMNQCLREWLDKRKAIE